MSKKLIIGSRGSQLALWQAHHIAAWLNGVGVETSIQIIKTTGDHLQTASLVQAGGKGLFTKEIEEALLAGAIDVAVHSLKDLPTQNPPGLTIAAIPKREDPRDALVGKQLAELKPGSRVGTSSSRRASQLRILCPGIVTEPIRGNVDTRLRKLAEGQFDAILLAAAGLRRLGLEHHIAHTFSAEEICPAPGQGALAVQTRSDDEAQRICAALNHDQTAAAVRCERAVLAGLGGGCQLPIGAFAEVSDRVLHVIAGVFSPDGSGHVSTKAQGTVAEPEVLGTRVAQELLDRGARLIMRQNVA